MEEHPENIAVINEAATLVRSVNYHSYSISDKEKQQLWESVKDAINNVEIERVPEEIQFSKKRYSRYTQWALLIAAVFTGIIMVGVFWYNKDQTPLKSVSFSAHTGFGEVKKLILPDSSEVTLNANSYLVYSENNNQERQVTLTGEANFHVKHTVNDQKFLVHTFDKLTIEVLGTSFNVNDGEDKIIVVLQQGSIKLEIDDEGDSNKTQLYLKPGEMISYNKRKGDYTKRVVDTEKFDSWVNGTLKMDNYSLRDASAFMKQLFGKKLIIVDTALMAYRISGSMPIVYSEDTMLIQFAKAFNVHLKKDGQKIRVEKNNP